MVVSRIISSISYLETDLELTVGPLNSSFCLVSYIPLPLAIRVLLCRQGTPHFELGKRLLGTRHMPRISLRFSHQKRLLHGGLTVMQLQSLTWYPHNRRTGIEERRLLTWKLASLVQ